METLEPRNPWDFPNPNDFRALFLGRWATGPHPQAAEILGVEHPLGISSPETSDEQCTLRGCILTLPLSWLPFEAGALANPRPGYCSPEDDTLGYSYGFGNQLKTIALGLPSDRYLIMCRIQETAMDS